MSVFLLVSNHIANGIIHGGKARMVCGIAKRENHRDLCVPRDQEKCDQDQGKKKENFSCPMGLESDSSKLLLHLYYYVTLTIMLLVVVKGGGGRRTGRANLWKFYVCMGKLYLWASREILLSAIFEVRCF